MLLSIGLGWPVVPRPLGRHTSSDADEAGCISVPEWNREWFQNGTRNATRMGPETDPEFFQEGSHNWTRSGVGMDSGPVPEWI